MQPNERSGGHPVFTTEAAQEEFQAARDGRWKRRWQLRGTGRWEPLWPLGVAGSAAGRIGRHWRAERRTITVGLSAFTLSALGGLVAGLVLVSITGTIERFPGFILLVPAAIGIRGNIFGAMGSRLGTALQLGTFELRLLRGGVLQQNLVAVTLLTVIESAIIGVAAWCINLVLERPTMSVWDFTAISFVGGLATSVVVCAATVGVTWLAVRCRWDLDSVVAPIITLIGDTVGIPLLAVAAGVLAGRGAVTQAAAIVCLALALGTAVQGFVGTAGVARRIFLESLPILAFVALIDLLAGVVIEGELPTLISFSVFLIVLPAFLSAAGGLGSMFVSRLGSKIHLGTVEPRIIPDPLAVLDSTLVYLYGFVVFPVMALLASAIGVATGASSPGVARVVEVTLAGGALATTIALLVGYYTALVTVRYNLDPDNHGIPAVTSTMDFFGVLALALVLLGVT